MALDHFNLPMGHGSNGMHSTSFWRRHGRNALGIALGVGEVGAAIHGYTLLAGASTSVMALLGEQITPLVPLIKPFVGPALTGGIVMTTASSAAIVRQWRLERRQRASDGEKLRRREAFDRSRTESARQLATFESENALCDLALQALLCDLDKDDGDRKQKLEAAAALVNANIRSVLNVACSVLQNITGKRCAVSIKIILPPSEETVASVKLRTVYRDATSWRERGHNNSKTFGIDDNTATEKILRKGDAWYICDDLPAAALEGKYRNAREGWENDYTATIAVPIRSLTGVMGVPTFGVLFADSLEAKFAGERCLELLRALTWRLSVMLSWSHTLGQLNKPRAAKSFWESMRK